MKKLHYGKSNIPQDNIVVLSIDADFLSIDPTTVNDYIGVMISQALFETLVVLDHNTSRITMGAAKSYEIQEDGKKYIFYINSNAKWSNGEKVTAGDFEYAFKRILIEKSPTAQLMYDIVNAEEIDNGEINKVDELGVCAINKEVFQITLKHPVSNFLDILTDINFAPLPKVVIEEYGDRWTSADVIISNGPFALKEYKKEEYALLYKNPYYFNSKEKKIQGIKFEINKDIYSQLESYKENKVHSTCNTSIFYNMINEFIKYDDFFIETLSIGSFLFFNWQRNLFLRDVNIRKALLMSIDKKLVCEKMHNCISILNDFVPNGIQNYESNEKNIYNSNEAIKHLKESKNYKKVKASALKIMYADFYPNYDILVCIVEMIKEVLDINITLQKVSLDSLVKNMEENNFDMIFSLIPANYNDPLAFLQCFIQEEILEDMDWDSDKCMECISDAIEEINIERKNRLYKKADDILMNALPAIPLFNFKSIYFKKPYLKGYKIFSCGQFSFRYMDIDDTYERVGL